MLEVLEYTEYSKKVFAKQKDPAYMSSTFWFDFSDHNNGTSYDDFLILSYDRHSSNVVKSNELLDSVIRNVEEAHDITEDPGYYAPYFKNFTDYITRTFNPVKKLSTRAIHRLKVLFSEVWGNGSCYYFVADELAEIMTIISGEKWATTALNGYCQGDTVTAIYKPSEWTDKALESVETEYWNGGSEWLINMGDYNLSVYSTGYPGYDDEQIIADIADATGEDPGKIVLETC